MTIETPEWVKHAVFYQIFPDRFARSERSPLVPGTAFKAWGSDPAEQGFQGGDLYGIIDRLGYLQDLGVTALYLNPIFASASNHRYHTFDYYQVDPLLGGNEALADLLEAAHARDIRVVLDGVFNHASRGFWPFHHILETGGNSPYLDWFTVHGWPLRPYQHTKKTPHNYAAWWDLAALPKLNTKNEGIRAMIFDVTRHWLDFGIDGWRLDVPQEIDDADFWRMFRQIVKDANPEAYIVGEIWGNATEWLQGDQFDAVMNYPLMSGILSFVGHDTLRTEYQRDDLSLKPRTGTALAKYLTTILDRYDPAVNQVQLNLLDSHDTARAAWILNDDPTALRLAVLFIMTMPGAPCIYYGDEVGLSAGDDPHCREAFPWDERGSWDTDLLSFYQQAIALRHAHPVLRTGTVTILDATERTLTFTRSLPDAEILVAFNVADEGQSIALPADWKRRSSYQQIWPARTDATLSEEQTSLPVPARSAVLFASTSE